MWILVAEAMVALGLLVFIVWWTLGPTQRRERAMLDSLAREAEIRRHASRDGDAPDPLSKPTDEGSTERR